MYKGSKQPREVVPVTDIRGTAAQGSSLSLTEINSSIS